MAEDKKGKHPGGRPRSFMTPDARALFIASLSESGNVTWAAEKADLDRRYLYFARARDEDFREEWEEAAKVGAERLKDEANRRAILGWDEPVFQKGELVGVIRKYSDTLLLSLLKAHHEEFRDRQTITHGGELTVNSLTDEQLKARMAQLMADPAIRGVLGGGDE